MSGINGKAKKRNFKLGSKADMFAPYGERIRERRIERQYSLSDLSKTVGMAKSYLSNIENGHRKRVSRAVLSDLANALDVSVDDLGHEIEQPKKKPSSATSSTDRVSSLTQAIEALSQQLESQQRDNHHLVNRLTQKQDEIISLLREILNKLD